MPAARRPKPRPHLWPIRAYPIPTRTFPKTLPELDPQGAACTQARTLRFRRLHGADVTLNLRSLRLRPRDFGALAGVSAGVRGIFRRGNGGDYEDVGRVRTRIRARTRGSGRKS